jgi:hypothetical protein
MTQKLVLGWQALSVPKQGHSSEEYEDAFAADPEAGRFAVADGASETSFAALWARLLTAGFVEGDEKRGGGWLGPLRQRWAAEVDGRALPWYAEAKRDEGAFATLVGLTVKPSPKRGGTWRALAVGDSCLFLVRGQGLVKAFPLTRADEFDNRPRLVGSRPPPGGKETRRPKQAHGKCQAGDRFFLMTDALAEWFLRHAASGFKPWLVIEQVLAESATDRAAEWIEGLRDRGGLRNDDVTLLRVETAPEPARRAVGTAGKERL